MPDARPPEAASAPPEDWGQVLAALPLEAPPEGGWQRIAQQLPKRRSPARIWVPAALAASLALLLVAPWKTQPPPATQVNSSVASTAPRDQPIERAPASTVSTQPPAASTHDTAQVAVAAQRDVAASQPERLLDAATQPSRSSAPQRMADTHKTATVAATTASTDKKAATPHGVAADTYPTTAAATNATASPSQEDLYAESARLEALLAQIRDDRVSSGTAMALSAELHDRLGGIDAALSQPELEAGERLSLWRERVATLQRLTGVESTQRWMAANGYRADGQVAQIY